jgi:hypothetical protein
MNIFIISFLVIFAIIAMGFSIYLATILNKPKENKLNNIILLISSILVFIYLLIFLMFIFNNNQIEGKMQDIFIVLVFTWLLMPLSKFTMSENVFKRFAIVYDFILIVFLLFSITFRTALFKSVLKK